MLPLRCLYFKELHHLPCQKHLQLHTYLRLLLSFNKMLHLLFCTLYSLQWLCLSPAGFFKHCRPHFSLTSLKAEKDEQIVSLQLVKNFIALRHACKLNLWILCTSPRTQILAWWGQNAPRVFIIYLFNKISTDRSFKSRMPNPNSLHIQIKSFTFKRYLPFFTGCN